MNSNTGDTSALDGRLAFMKLDEAASRRLRAAKAPVMDALPGALDAFYDQVRAFPETRAFFASEAAIGSAKSRQLKHWEALSEGRFDGDYLRAVTAVGEVHARIGLEPRWYIGGYALVLETLVAAVVAARWPKTGGLGFGAKGPGADQVGAEIGAVVKATLLDMELAISVYLEASERARKALEDETRATSEAVMETIGGALTAMAEGDVTRHIGDEMPAAYGRLRDDYNGAIDKVRDALARVRASSVQIGTATDEITAASDDLSRRTEQQAASLEETAAALEQITATVQRTASGARSAKDAVTAAKDVADRSGEVVSKAVSAMNEIESSSKEISQIIGVIDEIAFQTNLLALNAGVEAARAGDAGRGFAVVASEVRALAQRSAEAAKEIKTLISTSSQQVSGGVGLVNATGQALREIVDSVSQIDGLVAQIAASAQEQATGLGEVNTAVNQMDQITQQNAAMVEQSTAAAHSLQAEISELGRLMSAFHTGEAPARPAPRARPAARSPVHALNRKLAAGVGAAPAARDGGWEEF